MSSLARSANPRPRRGRGNADGGARSARRSPEGRRPDSPREGRRPSSSLPPTARTAALADEAARRGDAGRSRASANRELRRRSGFDGDFAQALADGAVEEARVTLERRVRAHLPRGTLDLTLTDNRYTMISVRRDTSGGPVYRVRLHHMFVDAGPAVTRALARYVARNEGEASRLLGDYIDANQHRVRPRSRRGGAPTLVTRGEIHDLRAIFDDLNRRYFGGGIDARITWGQRTGRPRKRNSIKMGSYSVEDRLIRIHRSLDREFVPRFFVEWIVYHEMLHQIHDVPVVNGRRRFHTRAFLEDEARFEHYALARTWERAHLDELLTY